MSEVSGKTRTTVSVLPRLSPREKDCLIWTAQGKSSWDIGVILEISRNTVNFHIKNAMKKLETSSRTVAVIKAIQYDMIAIPGYQQSQTRALRGANQESIISNGPTSASAYSAIIQSDDSRSNVGESSKLQSSN